MMQDVVDARMAALGGLFDDAAMFPPASRELGPALAGHRAHRAGERAWLVRRFLVRASDASALPEHLDAEDDIELGVILDRASGAPFPEGVAGDLVTLAALARDKRVRLSAVEVALPGKDPAGEVAAVLAGLQGARLPDDVGVVLEVEVNGRPAGQVLRGLGAIQDARRAGGKDAERLAAKIRCGGTGSGDVPHDLEVAGFLRACARDGIPFKATAGLHHPTRHINEVGALEHGFLNIIAAALVARRGARLDAIKAQLSLTPDEIRLGPGALVAGNEIYEGPELATTRQFFLGIGCCAITDPVTDLAELGVVTSAGGLR